MHTVTLYNNIRCIYSTGLNCHGYSIKNCRNDLTAVMALFIISAMIITINIHV